MDAISGRTTLPFSILHPFPMWGQLLKEQNRYSLSKFFPIKVDCLLEGLCHPGISKQAVTKGISLGINVCKTRRCVRIP